MRLHIQTSAGIYDSSGTSKQCLGFVHATGRFIEYTTSACTTNMVYRKLLPGTVLKDAYNLMLISPHYITAGYMYIHATWYH